MFHQFVLITLLLTIYSLRPLDAKIRNSNKNAVVDNDIDIHPKLGQEIANILNDKQSSLISFRVFQNLQSSGTLLKLSDRDQVIIQLDTDASTAQLRLSYRSIFEDGVRSISGSLQLSDGRWHNVSLFISNGSLSLMVDCRTIIRNFNNDFDQNALKNDDKTLLVASVDPVLHFPGIVEQFSVQRAEMEPRCEPRVAAMIDDRFKEHNEPVTVWNQPKAVADMQGDLVASSENTIHEDVDYLRHRMQHVESELRKWRGTVENMSLRLNHVQLHQRGCLFEGQYLTDGSKLIDNDTCTECHCSRGKLECRVVGCPLLDCAHVVRVDGQCCPKCGKQCTYMATTYNHSSEYWPKKCIKCFCFDGNMKCGYHRARNEACPVLDCPESEQHTLENRCCPTCINQDFCESNPCHANATCTNAAHDAVCKCNEGFFGDGQHCFDVDECVWDASARTQLGGCGLGTRCINLPGSFRCECLPGYARIDERTCLDAIFP